jgi:NADPH:quinone reductase-like Zn-dependent oxidoreductase
VYPKPANLSFVEAAAFPLTFLTAWHMLVGRADVQKGESVFIWGASGSLGSAAVQLAQYLGARVIAATRSEDAAKKIRAVGADESVLYTETDVVHEVQLLTNGLGVDVVFESVGEKTWQQSIAMLRMLGRLVIAGTTSGDNGAINLSDLYYKQLTILGARMGTKEEFEKVLSIMESGTMKPVIDSVFPLEKSAEAQRRMEEGKHVGKIVLEVP